MALKRKSKATSNSNNEDYAKLENGEYEARLCYVADLGIQEKSYMGEVKEPQQQIALGYEILGQHVTIDGKEQPRFLWGKPFYIAATTMDERSNEYKAYKIFDTKAKPDTMADWDAVLGAPCSVTIGKSKSKDGASEYDNIDDVAPIPEKYRKDVPKGEIEPCIGDCDDANNEATKALYGLTKWVFEKRIVENPFA